MNSERSGWRDRAYSEWHRTLGDEFDFLDIDWIERCHECKKALAIYELCADIDRETKPANVTRDLAAALQVPSYLVLYAATNGVLERLRVRRLDTYAEWQQLTPKQWAAVLASLRVCHPIGSTARSAWCNEHAPDEAEVCTLSPGHSTPHHGPSQIWPLFDPLEDIVFTVAS